MLPAAFVDVNRSPSRTDDGSLSDYFFRLTPIPTNVLGSSIVTQHARSREPFSTAPLASDPDFVDRPEILAWTRNKCAEPGARAALVGLGGVGKSRLAIQYAHNIRDATPHMFVFWVHASTKARFGEAYRNIADRLELQGRDNPKMDIGRLVSN
ncbi:hypothetical protein GQ44DRAFT_779628 [Phaeosphaeriaceae sp. PMI808]|nr:hypothetical protein GQ44DRAFT_779628 [Phaeosphaeriaceae sp. PMI808]